MKPLTIKFPPDLLEELKKEALAYKIPYGRYMRAILQHRKLMDMGNPEFVKSLYLKS